MAKHDKAGGSAGKADSSKGKDDARPVNDSSELSTCAKAPLAKSGSTLTIGAIEAALLHEFPRQDAEAWDKTGLCVGDASAVADKVAVALDVTPVAICEAAAAGANVLVTHHPVFLNAPDTFTPDPGSSGMAGSLVWTAMQNKVALMNFHTALDVSPYAARVLPSMLGLTFSGRLVDEISPKPCKGYGQICSVAEAGGKSETLAHIAARCTSVFGRPPRVWGNFNTVVRTVITATGSASNLVSAVAGSGIDCLICGEIKYHDALELFQTGVAVVELGHDVSELPLVGVLAEAIERIGVAKGDIVVVDQSGNWRYPEAIRV